MIRKALTRVAYRLFESVVARAMPIVLKHYYSIYAEQWHPHHALRRAALAETVDYIRTHMPNAMIKENEYQVLTYAGNSVSVDGLFLEFGVRTGSTINHIASEHPDKSVYGFDSFQGLPEAWSGWVQDKGVFAMSTLPEVNANVELVVGGFADTLPEFIREHPGSVAFVHIDSDLYSSARTVLDNLASRFEPGSIVVFNEYFNYPNWQQHEFKALQEFCTNHGVEYEYLCWGQFEVAIRITSIHAAGANAR